MDSKLDICRLRLHLVLTSNIFSKFISNELST